MFYKNRHGLLGIQYRVHKLCVNWVFKTQLRDFVSRMLLLKFSQLQYHTIHSFVKGISVRVDSVDDVTCSTEKTFTVRMTEQTKQDSSRF